MSTDQDSLKHNLLARCMEVSKKLAARDSSEALVRHLNRVIVSLHYVIDTPDVSPLQGIRFDIINNELNLIEDYESFTHKITVKIIERYFVDADRIWRHMMAGHVVTATKYLYDSSRAMQQLIGTPASNVSDVATLVEKDLDKITSTFISLRQEEIKEETARDPFMASLLKRAKEFELKLSAGSQDKINIDSIIRNLKRIGQHPHAATSLAKLEIIGCELDLLEVTDTRLSETIRRYFSSARRAWDMTTTKQYDIPATKCLYNASKAMRRLIELPDGSVEGFISLVNEELDHHATVFFEETTGKKIHKHSLHGLTRFTIICGCLDRVFPVTIMSASVDSVLKKIDVANHVVPEHYRFKVLFALAGEERGTHYGTIFSSISTCDTNSAIKTVIDAVTSNAICFTKHQRRLLERAREGEITISTLNKSIGDSIAAYENLVAQDIDTIWNSAEDQIGNVIAFCGILEIDFDVKGLFEDIKSRVVQNNKPITSVET